MAERVDDKVSEIFFSAKVSSTGRARFSVVGADVVAEYEQRDGSSAEVRLVNAARDLGLRGAGGGVAASTVREAPGEELGDALDALNAELGAVEDWLEAQGFRVRAEVPLPSGGALAWGKVGNRWWLLSVGRDGHTSVLSSTSAARRLEAVPAVPALVEACRGRQGVTVAGAEDAVAQLRALRGAA